MGTGHWYAKQVTGFNRLLRHGKCPAQEGQSQRY
jgi:hypothetical protein